MMNVAENLSQLGLTCNYSSLAVVGHTHCSIDMTVNAIRYHVVFVRSSFCQACVSVLDNVDSSIVVAVNRREECMT